MATMVESLLSEESGQRFGSYTVVRRLGAGGMAETFEAVRHGPSGFAQRVCLKLVLPALRNDREFIELFEREARVMARLRHSNIVGVIDFGSIDGRSYIAAELVDGVDLLALQKGQSHGQMGHEQVSLLALDLVKGLAHAHSPARGSIIHRDLSPSNVMVSHEGEILLADFGLAKALDVGSRGASNVKGKVGYMSPEQLRDERLDGRTDLFSLGVLLFECLAGRRPFHGIHDPATILLILNGEHPPLREFAPDVPEGLCRIVENLIEADRDARPPSASALLEQLDEFTPSRRARRELGEMVEPLRDEARADTSAFGDYASGPTVRSGFVQSGEDEKPADADEPIPSTPHGADMRTSFVATAVIMTVTIIAGLILLGLGLLSD